MAPEASSAIWPETWIQTASAVSVRTACEYPLGDDTVSGFTLIDRTSCPFRYPSGCFGLAPKRAPVPSSSGLGHHPLKVETRVRTPLGLPGKKMTAERDLTLWAV